MFKKHVKKNDEELVKQNVFQPQYKFERFKKLNFRMKKYWIWSEYFSFFLIFFLKIEALTCLRSTHPYKKIKKKFSDMEVEGTRELTNSTRI